LTGNYLKFELVLPQFHYNKREHTIAYGGFNYTLHCSWRVTDVMGLVWNLDETPLHMEDYRCDGSSIELKDAEIFPTVIHGGALIL
jgi:hypothetical protein